MSWKETEITAKITGGGDSAVIRVDQLMYQAKKSGKDRVCSEP